MNVLLLSPYPEGLLPALAGDTVLLIDSPNTSIDFIISFGCRRIIREPVLSAYRDRLINLHTSFLPFNRGADPEYWAARDGTPQGVSIHHIDAGIDTGDLIAQRTVATDLKAELRLAACALFSEFWPLIRSGLAPRWRQPSGGSFHRLRDRPAA